MTPTSFAHAFADRECSWLSRCAPDTEAMLYEDGTDCRQTTVGDVTGTSGCMERHCTFDPAAARGCVDALAGTCEVVTDPTPAACARVWAGCDGSESVCSTPSDTGR